MTKGENKTSIIILTYNNWPDTKLCLDSIFTKTSEPDFEVILVDNASQDGTPGFLQEYATAHPNMKLIINPRNAGFSRANNQGAELAEGEYLVFLNNDTVVTPKWLSGLIKYLDDPSVGMVGPVTNSASNESRILVNYDSLDGLDAFAEQYTSAHAGQAFDIKVLAFFCVAMRRAVFEEIGPLDERFGLGFFEDDDYAARLRKHGYRLLCAEDVFVHHSGGKSFLKLETSYYWQLFRENRRKFEAKWEVKWQPHLHRNDLLGEQIIQVSEHLYHLQWALNEQMNLVNERDELLRLIRQQLGHYAYKLETIYSSRTWKLVQLMRQIRRKLAPEGSSRERVLLGAIALGYRFWVWLGIKPGQVESISTGFSDEKAPAKPDADTKASHVEIRERRIPILVPQFFNFTGDQLYIGGAERYLVELVSLIKSLEYQPVVYQSAASNWEREYGDMPVIGLPSGGDQQRLNQLFHDEVSTNALAIYFAFYLAYPMCNLRSIGISHGVYWDTNNNHPIIDQRDRFEAIINPIANLSRIVSVDTNTINWVRGIQSYLARKFVYIPNFVDLEQFRAPVGKKAGEKLIILYPRRLYQPRGFWLVKELVPEFVDSFPSIEFHFVGQADHDAEAAVQELVKAYPENVRWSTLPLHEMQTAYQSADITLIPTVNSEGTSLSCLEAMASGNAVIATNVGGLSDLVISGYNGILIEPTVSSLREALRLLCQNPPLRQLISNRAKEVAESFSLEHWRARWTKILKEQMLVMMAAIIITRHLLTG
jgi:GT2 family glycosyltransferase/glycosyltransferase involved in cell wall biosynthesis